MSVFTVSKPNLLDDLAKARETLAAAQLRVTQLENSLPEKQLNFSMPSESNHSFYYAFEHLLEGCMIIGFDWRYLYLNAAAARYAHQSKEDLLGRTVTEKYPGIEQTEIYAVLNQCMENRQARMAEHEFTYPEGDTAWFEFSVQPVPEGIFILMLDSTARKQTTKELAALYNATSYLFKADNLLQLGQQIVEAVVQEFDYADCGLMLIDRERSKILRLARTGEYGIRPEVQLMVEGQGLVPLSLRTGQPVYAPDVRIDLHYFPSESRTQSEFVIPLRSSKKEVIGVLDLQSSQVDAFSERDQRILTAYAERAGSAIENMQFHEALDQHAAELEARVVERTAELDQAKARVEAILNSSTDGILSFYTDSGIQQSNTRFNSLFRCHPNDYMGRSLLTLIHADYIALVTQTIQAVMADQLEKIIEVRACRKDGSVFEAEIGLGCIHSASIQPQGLVCTIRDISEQKQTEELLAEERNRLRTLIDAIPDFIYVKDLNHRFLVVNQTFASAHGYQTSDEMLGKTDLDHFPTAVAEVFHQNEDEIFQTGIGTLDHEEPLIEVGGRSMWVSSDKVPLRNLKGEIIGIAGTSRDITQRKQAQQALEAKTGEDLIFQKYLKDLHEITIELMQIDHLDRFYKRAVELGLERFGFERLGLFLYNPSDGTASGTYGTDIYGTVIDEHHLRFSPGKGGVMWRAFQGMERFCFDDNMPLFNNRQPVGIGWNAAATLWNGTQSIGWLVTDNFVHRRPASKPLLDILSLYAMTIGTLLARNQAEGQLRQSEARYRLLAENISDVVIQINPMGDYLYVSPSSQTLLGYSAEEMVGQSAFQFINPDDLNGVVTALERALQGSIPPSLIYRFCHKQGHDIWLEATGQIIQSEQTGEPLGFVRFAA